MLASSRENRFGSRGQRSVFLRSVRRGFTLIELLVVLCIVSVLMAALIPTLGKVRRQARAIVGVGNLRQITAAVDFFASDNASRYPPSVATIGFGQDWNWQPPTMLTAYLKRAPSLQRSVSAYLHTYLDDASVMFCPNAPLDYKYRQEAWDAGEEWDNPDTPAHPDALFGTYCFYWNYTGYLGTREGLFRGPSGPARRGKEGRIVVSDSLSYDHWSSAGAYGSCERFAQAQVTEGTALSSAYWSQPGWGIPDELRQLKIKLHAGYTDGHVESYRPADTRPMRVIKDRETSEPYTSGVGGQGIFYLPRVGLR